jgi:hypothetical protein
MWQPGVIRLVLRRSRNKVWHNKLLQWQHCRHAEMTRIHRRTGEKDVASDVTFTRNARYGYSAYLPTKALSKIDQIALHLMYLSLGY